LYPEFSTGKIPSAGEISGNTAVQSSKTQVWFEGGTGEVGRGRQKEGIQVKARTSLILQRGIGVATRSCLCCTGSESQLG